MIRRYWHIFWQALHDDIVRSGESGALTQIRYFDACVSPLPVALDCRLFP
jgi:hypothetical protein